MSEHKGKAPLAEAAYCPNCGSKFSGFTQFNYGNIELRNTDEVFFEGDPIKLTRNQYVIVDALVRAKGRLITRSSLAVAIDADVFDDAITAHIKRIRDSFRMASPDFDQIQVARGFGAYRWVFQRGSSGVNIRMDEDIGKSIRTN